MDEPQLPPERSSFVGRQADLDALDGIIANSTLLTIVGPPGVGKTRLALQIARRRSASFADGAVFLDLARVAAAESLVGEVIEQLGLNQDSGAEGIESLTRTLESREILLVLDNCEHLVEEAARLCAGLLARCSTVTIIATSREPLRVEGEVTWQLAPLALPARRATLHEVRNTDSAALFIDRARARLPTFALSEANKADVAEICEQADGLPLAIELAAALVGSLALAEIVVGLKSALGLLVSGSRVVDRHRTLRAAIDWSYSLLRDDERTVLLRASIFPGEFDIAAATAICCDGGVEQSQILPLIIGLTQKSLLHATPSGRHMRYRLLVPLRQYLEERVVAAGGAGHLAGRHLSYYLSLAESAEPNLMSGRREPSLEALELEAHNIRAALEWGFGCADSPGNEMAARLAAALLWFWAVAGHLTEGMSWLEKAEKLSTSLEPESRAMVLYTGGELAWLLGEEALGRAWLEESVSIWRNLGDQRRVAYCLQALSFLVDPELGREQARESIEIFRAVKDSWGEALAVHTLGLIESQRGDPNEGRAWLEEGLRRFQEIGDTYLMVQALNLLGDLDRNEDNYESARVHYEAAIAVQESSAYPSNRPSLLQNLGFVSFHLGDDNKALEHFRAAVALFAGEGDHRGVAESLTGIAAVLARRGEPERAVILSGTAGRILAEANATLWRSNRDDAIATSRDLLATLGEARFAALLREGESLPLREAVSRAVADPGPRRRTSVEQPGAPLSPREQEVAILVARGYRNREIAEALVITEGTARLHVKHVLRRLGFSSRAEIAAWAAGRGLLGQNP
jgi:predicted ATPase/DNA-binding CsgD family transcriptional regulator